MSEIENEAEFETPSNDDVTVDENPLDELEFELPTPVEVPPEELQERLEAPSGIFHVLVEDGSTETVETDPATEPGVERVFEDPVLTRLIGQAEEEATGP